MLLGVARVLSTYGRPNLAGLGGWGTSSELWSIGSSNSATRRHALCGWKSWAISQEVCVLGGGEVRGGEPTRPIPEVTSDICAVGAYIIGSLANSRY